MRSLVIFFVNPNRAPNGCGREFKVKAEEYKEVEEEEVGEEQVGRVITQKGSKPLNENIIIE